ncbi:MAG: ABC transporter ATP-binding protein [Acidimicrobiia bacterium]
MTDVVLALRDVALRRDGNTILERVDLEVREGEHWVVLGPNGSGKTSMLRIASLWLHPSSGEVEVLGGRLGSVDVRRHRIGIGLASQAFGDLLRADQRAADVVMAARNGALETWWHTYTEADRRAALDLLGRFGVGHRADHLLGTLSSGERQRVMLARAFSGSPGLVLLDEPTAGLDLGGREDLVGRLAAVAGDPAAPATVLVTHHVEEIPVGTTHAALLRDGRIVASGPAPEVLTGPALGELFGLPLELDRRGGRYQAWRAGAAPSDPLS